MSKSAFLAALLGGLFGGVFSFWLTRSFPAPVKAPPPPAVSEARQYTDELMQLLKTGKYDEFFKHIRPAFPALNDEQFEEKVRKKAINDRAFYAKEYGASGELEFSRETVLSPSVVRVSYVEKYERGCIVYVVVVYNSPDGWRVLAFGPMALEAAFALVH